MHNSQMKKQHVISKINKIQLKQNKIMTTQLAHLLHYQLVSQSVSQSQLQLQETNIRYSAFGTQEKHQKIPAQQNVNVIPITISIYQNNPLNDNNR